MSSFGIIDQGFGLKTFQEILNEVETAQRAALGTKINQQADSVLGILNGIFCDKLAEINELAQAIRAARAVSSASTANLDDVLALAGITRQEAVASFVVERMNLAANTTVIAGKITSIGPSGEQWALRTDVVNSSSDPAVLTGTFDCTVTGPIPGNSGTIDTIITPVSGWSAKAVVEIASVGPYNLTGGASLSFACGAADAASAGNVVVNFVNGDFSNPAAATATEICTKINSSTTYLHATALGSGGFRIEDTLAGTGSYVWCYNTASYTAPVLPLPQFKMIGFNPDTPPYITCGNAGPYNFTSGSRTLIIERNGTPHTVTFANASTSAVSAATQINTQIAAAGITADVVGGLVRLSTGASVGASISIQITGGTTVAAFAFSELLASGIDGDATTGTSLETDATFRQRYFSSLSLPGSGTIAAIQAIVSKVSGVTSASALDNPTSTTDVNGIMPYGVAVFVSGGSDNDVAAAIFSKLAAGTPTYRDPGSQGRTIAVLDVNGTTHNINFTRSTEVPIYVALTVKTNPLTFGGGDSVAGATSVAQAIKQLGDQLQSADGADVIALRYEAVAFGVTGVIDVTSFTIDTVNPPLASINIPIAVQSYASFSTARIFVTVTT